MWIFGHGASFLAALLGEAMLPACSRGWEDLLPGLRQEIS